MVTVAGHSGTDVLPAPTTLTFTSMNWETAQTVTVTAVNDADTTNDTVSLTHSAASTDTDYDGITIAGVPVTVEDNDTAQVTGVMLTPGDGELAVAWAPVPNATGYEVQWKSGGQGYNTSGRQATIGSGSTASHTISSLTNGTTYTVRVRATRTGANAGPYSDEAMDAPEAAGVTVSETALTVTEEDSNGDSYTVVLNTQPTANVVVTVAGHSGTDVLPAPTSLTFTSMNWETAQTVTVTAVNDADTTNDTVSLTHSAASTDTDYDGITIAGVPVTVEDNDTAKVTGLMLTPGVGELAVAWTQVPNATGYEVQWKSGGQSYNNSGRQATIGSGSTVSHTIPNLTNGTTYTVRMRATRTGANAGPYSDEAMDAPEAAGVTVSKTALTVTEEDTTGDSYTVVLDSQPTANVVVTVAGHSGTDVLPAPTTLTFTSMNWETAQTVTVTAVNDADTTNDTVSLTHSAASTDTDYDAITIDGVTVTVEDNDTAKVTGVALTPGVGELAVAWTQVPNATGYEVQWKSGGQSYNNSGRQATIGSGSTVSHTIPNLTNGTTYTVRMRATRTGANAGPYSDEAMDAPEAPGTSALSFASANITVNETAGTATLTVELDPASTGTVTVDFATSDGTAKAGVDYTAASGTLTFDASETSKTITVPILNDTDYDPTQRFEVTLSNASGATLPTSPLANVNIINDDAVPTASIANVTVGEGAGTMTLTLALDRLSNGDITYSAVTAGVSGTATVADDYVAFLQGGSKNFTVPAGNLSQTFDITLVDDSLDEPDETIIIIWDKLSNSDATPTRFTFTGTITDNDPNNPATGKPRISGTAEVGQTLTADTSGISEPDGKTKAENGDADFAYTYQWYQVDAGAETPIGGARGRGSTYTLAQADEGMQFQVEVRFADDAGNSEGPLKSTEYPPDAEDGELRLEGGPSTTEGRLEVFHDGEWGTVCGDQFDEQVDDPRTLHDRRRISNLAPQKACQFMGYATGEVIPRGSISMAPSAQQIWLDDVRCLDNRPHWTGSEPTKLHHCYHAGWGLNNCTHDEDVHLRCVEGLGMQTEATALTASFEDMPQSHDGSGVFTFRIAFSEDVDIGRLDMKDHALTVTGGTVKRAKRVDGRSDLWEFRVEPSGTDPVSILVPQDRACTEPGALCTADGQMLTAGLGHSVPAPAPEPEPQGQQALEPLAASFVSVPAEHDGETDFWLELSFNAAVEQGSKQRIQGLLGASGGSVTRLRRKDGRLDHWQVRLEPSSHEAVTVTLSPSPACGAAGAVCTPDGRTYTTALATQIQGPPGLAVADAEVEEAANARLAFAVTLSRAPSWTVTVDYATSDGTAAAGSDYTATSGTLTFAAGETEKTVSVPVLDDAHDEGSETLTLTLTNPSGAYLADGSATGTITNTDHMPQAWLARFGRTVADQVLDAVDARLREARTAGMSVSLGGQQIGGAALKAEADGKSGAASDGTSASLFGGTAAEDAEDTARLKALSDWLSQETEEKDRSSSWSRTMTERELLMGSSFSLAAQTDGGGFAGLWGRMAQTSFAGREGTLSLDGDVTTGLLGADYAWGRWMTGLVLSHSIGEGGYRGETSGEIEATVTAVTPWARYTVTERLSVWGAAGYGGGELKLTAGDDPALKTDLGMTLAAAGARGTLVGGDGPKLDAVGDVRLVRTTTARVSSVPASDGGNLASASAEVTRLRLGLEGSWPLALGDVVLGKGAAVTPRLAIGVRQDGGDAETGLGADIGGGVTLAAPAQGLTVSLEGRGVLTHEAAGLMDRGIAGSLAWNPPPTGRGPKLTLTQSIGAGASGGKDALLSRTTLEGLAVNDNGDDLGQRRLDLRAGYGLAMFGGGFTGTPEIGFGLSESASGSARDYSLGWRLTRAGSGAGSLEFLLEARRRESANDDVLPEHGIGFRATARW